MKISDYMTTDVVSVAPEATFKGMAELLIERDISGVPVVDEEARLVGIVTEADLMSREAFGPDCGDRPLGVLSSLVHGERRWAQKAAGLTAAQIMTKNVVTAAPEEDVSVAARRMLAEHVKRLPVVDAENRLVGIVSRHDILGVFHRSDNAISAEVAARLASPLYSPDGHSVTADVDEGVVILSGHVREEQDIRMMAAIARHVPGVVDVVSHVRCEQPGLR